MIILLDTNIIIEDPSILAKKRKDVTLAITQSIQTELSILDYVPKGESVYKLFDAAFKMSNIQIYPSQPITDKDIYGYRIGKADIDILQCARTLKEKGDDVAIATLDKIIIIIAGRIGIKTLNLNELKEIFGEKDVIVDKALKERADRWSSTQLKNLLISVIVPIGMSIVGNIIWNKSDIIISSFPIWGTIIAILLLAIGAYGVRGRYRLSYGIFEFLIGLTIGVRVFYPSFDYGKLQAVDFLQIMGGLYIMVRGQDNIGLGLKGTKFGRFWSKLSGERKVLIS